MFADSTVTTPFPLKILMWETALCWSPLFIWETEAGEGVALPGEEGNSRGCWGCSPVQPPPGLISLPLLADETVTLEIMEPITHQLT